MLWVAGREDGRVRPRAGRRGPPLPDQLPQSLSRHGPSARMGISALGGGAGDREMHLKMQTLGLRVQPANSKPLRVGLRVTVWHKPE